MNGNIIFIITVIVLSLGLIVGLVRGFVKIIASLAATVLVILLVTFLTPYMSKMVLKVTPLRSMIQEECVEFVEGAMENVKEQIPELPSDVDASQLSKSELQALINKIDLPREQQVALLEQAQIPKVVRNMLLENNNAEIYKQLGVTTFGEYIGAYLAKIIASFVGFLITITLVGLVVHTVIYVLGLITDLPVIGGVNRILGGVLGVVIALIILWILFVGFTLFYTTTVGEIAMKNIADSKFLTFLYDNNPLLHIVTRIR